MVTGGFCASYTGDESLFSVDPSNVQYAASPYLNQERPSISVRKHRKGYSGNVRAGVYAGTDLSALSVSLVPVNATARAGTEQLRSIGMTVQQMLHCTAFGAGAAFSLVVVNDTIQVHSWFAAGDLQKALNPGTNLPSNNSAPFVNVTVAISPSSNSGKICGYNGTYVSTLITFHQPRGASLPLIEVVNLPTNVTAYAAPVVDGLDSVTRDPSGQPGLYTVLYTPTVAGAYTLQVQMGSVSIANDLVDAVVVTPSQEYAPTSTHNASQVVTQGAPEYFAVQMRDVFGNALTAPMASDSGT